MPRLLPPPAAVFASCSISDTISSWPASQKLYCFYDNDFSASVFVFFCSVAAVFRVLRILEIEAKEMMRRNCIGLISNDLFSYLKMTKLEVGIKKKMFTKPSLNIQSFQNLFPLFSRDFIK